MQGSDGPLIELNADQQIAKERAVKWFRKPDKQVHEIVGPAGSGKTTIVREIIRETGLKREEVLFMAFVGKATQALAMKGNLAKTIHASIYDVVDIPRRDEFGMVMMKNGRQVTRKGFERKKALSEEIKLIVLDEGGMVDKYMARDILAFDIPVLVLGDLDQLPPIFGNAFFLHAPDTIITMVMRQSLDSPILWLAELAKQGKEFPIGQHGNCRVVRKEFLKDSDLVNHEMIITGTNRTRDAINEHYQKNILQQPDYLPINLGDKIVCRQNNWGKSLNENIFLINGMVGFVDNIYLETFNKKSIAIDFRPDFTDEKFYRIPVDLDFLAKPATDKSGGFMSAYNKFQYANAITCHMSQGSQYYSVLYYKENIGSKDFRRRLDYTAITRAEEIITIAI